jgi:hypothetical protein
MYSYRTLAEALVANDPRWERPFICPVHNDHKASASVNVQKGVWTCYTCHAKGTTEGVEYDETLDLAYIDALLAEPQVLSERYLDMYREIHPYWLSRFSREACEHFQLGFDPVSGKPCYPIRDPNGLLLGVVTRNLDGDGPKYKYPRGIKVHNLLYNYTPQDRETVVLVEGAMDVVACWEAGHEAFGIYGSALSRSQVRLLQVLAPELVVLAFDNDRAGRAAADQAREVLDLDVVTVPWQHYSHLGDDLAELPTGTRKTLLDTLVL